MRCIFRRLIKKVDEYLIFIASESEIPWLDEYSQIEGLKVK